MVREGWSSRTGLLLAAVCIQHLAWQLQAAPASGRCYTSDRGYQCMYSPCSTITMHWSIGGPAPDGPCRYSKPANSNGTMDAVRKLGSNTRNATLHVALVSTKYRGWVGIAVPKYANMMAPGDAVVGVISSEGKGSVSPYSLQFYQSDNPQDTTYSVSGGSVMNEQAGLVMCFSRPVSVKGDQGIAWSLGDGPLNFGASDSNSLGEHELKCTTCRDCVQPAVSLMSFIAGFEPQAPVEEDTLEQDQRRVHRIHGWLMIVAWALLAPLGILAPRYRAAMAKAPLVCQHPTSRWFTLHTATQFLATLLFTVSCGIIIKFEGWQTHKWSDLTKAHAGIGVAIIVMLALHLLLALIRPAPDAKRRPLWRGLHISAAIITLALAFINLMIGPKVHWIHNLDGSQVKAMYVTVFVLLAVVASLAALARWCNRRAQAMEPLSLHSPSSRSSSSMHDLESPTSPLGPQKSQSLSLSSFPISTRGL